MICVFALVPCGPGVDRWGAVVPPEERPQTVYRPQIAVPGGTLWYRCVSQQQQQQQQL